ncbi:hypothetical protein BTS2_1062 [Bacillus sp. TS-2]|nr:hypothetical protein BTS2_1062 [Bacillus sp. TS-2]
MWRSIGDGFYQLCERFMALAILNGLWFGFTILGLGIFGWAPATYATFSVIRKQQMKKEADGKIFNTFFQEYKKEFFRANILGAILLLAAFSLYFSAGAFITMDSSILIRGILLVVAFLFSMILIYIFPVFSHFQIPLLKYIRYSFLLGLANLHYTIILFGLMISIIVLFGAIPVVMVFFLISLPASIMMFFSMRIFNKIQLENEQVVNG